MKTRTALLLKVWLLLFVFGTAFVQARSQDLEILVTEYRNVRVQRWQFDDRTVYSIDYESRALSLKMDGSMGDASLSTSWQATSFPETTAALADLFRWLEGKRVYSGLNDSLTEALFNFYKSQGFKFGETRVHTELGVTSFYAVFVSSNLPPKEKPVILSEPQSVFANPGDTIFFAVSAQGTEPLTYQWHKNGAVLQNGGGISGATSAQLTIANIVEADKGTYTVVVANSEGSVISRAASLDFDAVIRILSFNFNSDEGGLDFIYEASAETKVATTVELYWAAGTTLASKLSTEPVFRHDVPAGFSGRSQKIHIPGSKPDPEKSPLWNAPATTTHLVLAIDPENKVTEFAASKVKAIPDVFITYGEGVDSSRVSAWTLQAMRDIYRVAGHKLGKITSLARDAREQAEIMFKQMRNKEISSYGVGGEAVKNVYTTKVAVLDPVTNSAEIIEAMYQEVLAQEAAGNKVSNHIADSCAINAVDVGRNDITSRYGIAGRLRFLEAACADQRISRVGGPGGSAAYACFSFKDPTYHLDFPLPPDVTAQCRDAQGSSLNLVQSLPPAQPKNPAGLFQSAAVVPIEIVLDSGTASGAVDSGRAQFTFAGNEGDLISAFVHATTVFSGSKSQDEDSMLYLLDENSTVLASNDDPEFGELSAALETVRLPRTGTYTFIVTTFPNSPVLDANGKVLSWPDNGESKIQFDLEVELRRPDPVLHARASGEGTVIEWDGDYILQKLQTNHWAEVSRSTPYYLPAGETLDQYRLISVPTITLQPVPLTVRQGANAIFTVRADGVSAPSFQWQRRSGNGEWTNLADGQHISGSATETLVISVVDVALNGALFRALISNPAGAVASAEVKLTVSPENNAILITGIIPTPTSELTSLNRLAAHTVDGVYCDYNFWESAGVGFGSVDDRDPAITFDLRTVVSLSHFVIWNSHEYDPAIKRMLVEVSNDGETFTSLGEVKLQPGNDCPPIPQTNNLAGVQARFVRFDFLENWNGVQFPVEGPNAGWSFIAIDEIEFFAFPGPIIHLLPPQRVLDGRWKLRFSSNETGSFTLLRSENVNGPWQPVQTISITTTQAEFPPVEASVNANFFKVINE